ncbi:MAG: hypothetical protein JXQ87_08285 [Bacteroidia bacterium]
MKNIIFLMLLSSVCLVACDGVFDNDDCTNCENVVCTLELRTISITVEKTNGDPVELKSHKVYYTKSGKDVFDFNESEDRFMAPKSYAIASDNILDKLDCDGTSITFEYSLDGKTFVKEEFLVGKDCCHIQWRDEKEPKIVIE